MKTFMFSSIFILLLVLLFMPVFQVGESDFVSPVIVLDSNVIMECPLETSGVRFTQAVKYDVTDLNLKVLVYNDKIDKDESIEIYKINDDGYWNSCISKDRANYNIRFS